uniref:Putative secreted protein n=1 Tax=Anopheles darlingi TaxID=43151 RepID=A0A2M4D3M9_ANODA
MSVLAASAFAFLPHTTVTGWRSLGTIRSIDSFRSAPEKNRTMSGQTALGNRAMIWSTQHSHSVEILGNNDDE